MVERFFHDRRRLSLPLIIGASANRGQKSIHKHNASTHWPTLPTKAAHPRHPQQAGTACEDPLAPRGKSLITSSNSSTKVTHRRILIRHATPLLGRGSGAARDGANVVGGGHSGVHILSGCALVHASHFHCSMVSAAAPEFCKPSFPSASAAARSAAPPPQPTTGHRQAHLADAVSPCCNVLTGRMGVCRAPRRAPPGDRKFHAKPSRPALDDLRPAVLVSSRPPSALAA